MNRNLAFRFALVASCFFLALGYIFARLHSRDSIRIQVLPFQGPPTTHSLESVKSDQVE